MEERRYPLQKRGDYSFIDVGAETHGRPSFRLWVSNGIALSLGMEGQKELKFPIYGDIIKTQKGTLVLVPSEKKLVFDVFVRCGFRGRSEIEIVSPFEAKYEYEVFSSQRGSLGVSRGALVVVAPPQSLKYKWRRSGRLYGEEGEGCTVIFPDGKKEALPVEEEVMKLCDQ